ncbi:hypothetical protein [Paraburkholderia saeva]|nr:hypothetical protein [Paraburkholderia saeva]
MHQTVHGSCTDRSDIIEFVHLDNPDDLLSAFTVMRELRPHPRDAA